MEKERLNSRLEASGAEFLVLGNLLLRKILAHKAYTNFPGYDLLAVNPVIHKVCRIQVKSRFYSTDSAFGFTNFDCDFVVFVALNRSKISGNNNSTISVPINDPDYYIFPIEVIQKVHRKSKFPKVRIKDIPELQSYLNNWQLIIEYLDLPQ
jgi:hypothetical protein